MGVSKCVQDRLKTPPPFIHINLGDSFDLVGETTDNKALI